MKRRPLILITPSKHAKGAEMDDASVCVSEHYANAVLAAGGIPLIVPRMTDPQLVAECLRVCDGLLLTGGDDVNPKLYRETLSPGLEKTVELADAERDLQELMLVDEIFRQRKPLLAICRGHQVLNVALGGDLIVDIPQQVPGALNHSRSDRRFDPVHDVQLTDDSVLVSIAGSSAFGVNSSHHQAVGRAARPLKVTGRSDDGVIEVLELADEARAWLPWLLSVQAHPERLFDRYPEHLEIFRRFTGACANGFKGDK
ncbi:MAG: gamma-glutamyl-gamma-aminobutyrate hydrolase family protein [Verrucomicrobiota bacterium]